MLASTGQAPLVDETLVYEPKYDGIRALVEVEPAAGGRGRHARAASRPSSRPAVRIWSRLGNEKTSQFPELAAAFEDLGRALGRPILVDGEIVALDGRGEPAGFQQLQGRLHVRGTGNVARAMAGHAVAFIAFDLLRDGSEDLRPLPFLARRQRLQRRLTPAIGRRTSDVQAAIRLSPLARGDGRALYAEAQRKGLEGLIAKHARAPYVSGQRTAFWRKLKLTRRQEFVVGGWTDPKGSRPHFGALLLGVHPQRPAPSPQPLEYVGSVGSGFSDEELARLAALLASRRTGRCPFARVPRGLERAHWVRPDLVVEVKYTEWTAEGYLRHPVYLGQRTDRQAEEVVREGEHSRGSGLGARDSKAGAALLERLHDLEDRGRDGIVDLPDGHRLKVTNLRKIFWPKAGLTKGDLLRYYVEVAPWLLPAVADRPLVMKRFPDGLGGQSFYQQRAPARAPAGVRVAVARAAGEDEPVPRLVGGNWTTVMYMAQLAAISQDPWFSRVDSPLEADYAAFDLDPMEDVPFQRVLDVARWIHDELRALKVPAVPKTSGARGLHVYVPLAPGTPYEAGLLFCQIVATVVAGRHPEAATLERLTARRGRRVYIDCLQNIAGKTLATAYSARASEAAGMSTPLRWAEVEAGVDPRDFTIRTVPARLRETGDLWARLGTDAPVDLHAVLRRYERRGRA